MLFLCCGRDAVIMFMMQETKIRLHFLGILSYVFNICPTNRLFKAADL